MEPRVALNGNLHGRALQAEQLLATVFLQHVELAAQGLVATTQHLHVLGVEAVEHSVILLQGQTAHLRLRVAHMVAKHLPHQFGVAGTHHEAEVVVVFLGRLLLALVLAVAAYEQEDNQHDEGRLHGDAAIPHAEANQGAGEEGHTSRKEPSANHTQHTRDAEHGALAAPGAVGQTRTHGHHEGNVGSRERQAVVGTEGDEHGGNDEVHGSAHHIEGGLVVFQLHVVGIEAAVDPLTQAYGEDGHHHLDHALAETHDGAGGTT